MKPSNLFKPMGLVYPEDQLRKEFYDHHPWELARPKVVLEDTGRDGQGWDWGRGIEQPGKKLDGESVVLRQAYLLANAPKPKTPMQFKSLREETYDQARKEFYAKRMAQDVERQVAKEEAEHYGAFFDVGEIERSLEKEDAAVEDWKKWAARQLELEQHQKAGRAGNTAADVSTEENVDPDMLAGAEEAEVGAGATIATA